MTSRRRALSSHARRQKYLGIIVLVIALFSITPSQFAHSEKAPFLAQNDAAMAKMMVAMNIKRSNNVDKDFVAMMVPHHQGAIDMARAELSYGYNEQLGNLAQEIIATQQQEIVVMRLAEPPLSNPPS